MAERRREERKGGPKRPPSPEGLKCRHDAGTPRRASYEAAALRSVVDKTQHVAENSRSCLDTGRRGGGRAPCSWAAMSCGVVRARVTRIGPRQREHTEMSTRKTRASSVIQDSRDGAASRS